MQNFANFSNFRFQMAFVLFKCNSFAQREVCHEERRCHGRHGEDQVQNLTSTFLLLLTNSFSASLETAEEEDFGPGKFAKHQKV